MNTQRKSSDYSLFEAAKEHNQKAVALQILLVGDANKDDAGMTALHSASCYGNFQVVQLLLLHGAASLRASPVVLMAYICQFSGLIANDKF